jgi:hypothetical protein
VFASGAGGEVVWTHKCSQKAPRRDAREQTFYRTDSVSQRDSRFVRFMPVVSGDAVSIVPYVTLSFAEIDCLQCVHPFLFFADQQVKLKLFFFSFLLQIYNLLQ